MPLLTQITTYLQALQFEFSPLTVIDVLVVAVILYWIIAGLRGTRGIRILWSLILLGVIYFLAQIFNLAALEWLLRASFTIIAVAIPVVFQPELRKMLERAGRTSFLKNIGKSARERENTRTREAIVAAVKTLSENKTGALIAIARRDRLDDLVENATILNAQVSEELLLNIFFPKSPLHDGGIVIRDNRIFVASAIFPLSDQKKTYKYGTRHRAAHGLATETDAVVVIVSEERGTVSLAIGETMYENLTAKKLDSLLEANV
jgi:diadenylate cyclase